MAAGMTPVSQSSLHNLLLSRLTRRDFDALGTFERVDLPLRYVQEQANEPIRHIYFAESGLSSKIAVTESGERLEVGVIGCEGMTGMAVVHGNGQSPHETFMQVAGEGVRVSADGLREAMQASSSLRKFLLRYAEAFSVQVAHTALANGRFSIGERLARWLLMSQDRLGDEILLTHEFLSLMLGVRRAGVTEALQRLEGMKAIRSTRRHIKVLHRGKLKNCAGDCYGTPEAEYQRLIGVPIRAIQREVKSVT
jgi:CRP-like cAMP-binding protein